MALIYICVVKGVTRPRPAGAKIRRFVQNMLLIVLLVLIFWVMLPGLLTGWMLHELGRHFLLGLAIGVIFGPLGPFIALLMLPFVRSRPAHRRAHDPFYNVPLVGRLHVTTAWSLAGVVAFLCAWMIGGLGYEFYAARFGGRGAGDGRTTRLEANQRRARADGTIAPSRLQENAKPSATTQANNATPAAGQMVSGLAGPAGPAAPPSGPAVGTPPVASQTPANTQTSGPMPAAAEVAAVAVPSAAAAPPTPDAPPPTPNRPPVQAREVAVSEVRQGLASAGHRVHVALSGDAQTATLSISGPTLTRQAGNQLVGRTRQTLKAAGIRIVVMNNGPESWTYIL